MLRRGRRNADEAEEEGKETDHAWKEKKKEQQKADPQSIIQQPRWRKIDASAAIPPHDLLATSIEQKDDLLRARATYPTYSEEPTSAEWLESNSVSANVLTFEDLLGKCTITQTSDAATGSVTRHISITEIDLSEFESQLNLLIEAIIHRIHSLLIGSKKLFGVVKGKRVAIVVDASDANLGFGRLQSFQESLLHLIEEQLVSKAHLFIVTYGTAASCLWPKVRQVDAAILDEVRLWASGLKPAGGANLLAALKEVTKRGTEFDSVLLVAGAQPDQTGDLLIDFFLQSSVGRCLPVHAVAYDANSNVCHMTAKTIADATGGRFHCYSGIKEEAIYESTDIAILLDEIRTASEMLSKTSRMRGGTYQGAIVSIECPGAKEAANQDSIRNLPRPPGHEGPLRVQTPSFQARTSTEWLREHGLRAKGLNLYQVLAPDAYAPLEKFVPSIKKSVTSQVNANAMTQFTWHDGTLKNIHVNLPAVHEYQKKLEAAVLLYKRRMDWLSSGSRSIAGTLAEPTIMILIDISGPNLNYAIHIQHALRLILEQQMANKKSFNLIAFGGRPKFWQPDFVPVNEETLQSAWSWILGLTFHGSRNTLAAIRIAMENRFFDGFVSDCGIYLLSTGIPDQDPELICSYLSECCLGRPLLVHTIFLNVDDFDCGGAVPGKFASIEDTAHALRDVAHSTGGRFHWFKGSAAIESDDMKLISAEIEKAINFGTKATMIIDNVKNRPRKVKNSPRRRKDSETSPKHGFKASPVPSFVRRRNTVAPSLATISSPSSKSRPTSAASFRGPPRHSGQSARPNSRPWSAAFISGKPTSGTSPGASPGASSAKRRPHSAKPALLRPVPGLARSNSLSAAGGGGRPAVKVPSRPQIPADEDVLTSKQWLKRYSLKKLKIDLPRLFHGLDCKHDNHYVKTLGKTVSAKYCSIFPVVNIGGTIKHLQLSLTELGDYEKCLKMALQRYVRRMAWLMSRSHRIFGLVVHHKINILVDTSGSMVHFLSDLKKDLTSLIWDQLHSHGISFNLIAFASHVTPWREAVVEPAPANCHDAISWLAALEADGGTRTLDALELALGDENADAVYLLTDGKPDTSMAKVLSQVSRLNGRVSSSLPRVGINTISFNCDDHEANAFLERLARTNRGRFHSSFSIDNNEVDLWCHKMLEDNFSSGESHPRLPDSISKSDDLALLGAEIQMGRRFLDQSRGFCHLLKHAAAPHEKKLEFSTDKLLNKKGCVGGVQE